MQEHLTRALTFLHGALSFLGKGLKELFAFAWSRKLISLGVIVIAVGALITVAIIFKAPPAPDADGRREVEIVSVADVSSGAPITIIGEIRSVSEADVAADSSGRVTQVYRSLGDFVGAGTIIAEIENSSQRAAVAQAEASLDRAKSGATISGIGLGTAENGLTSAIESSKNTIASAYTTIDSAVHEKADEAFSNPNRADAKLVVSTSNAQAATNAENSRVSIQPILERQATAQVPADAGSLLVELETLSNETTRVRDSLASLVTALNSAIPSASVSEATIAGHRASAGAALSTINGLRSSITGTIENLKAKRAAVEISKENLSGTSGENPDVALAQASLNAARAVLEKTILRAPISGTINSIAIEQGNFVGAGSPVVRIVNTGGLEAVAYLSERDLPRVNKGSLARISGIADGRVSRIAPGLDPQTRKAEVRIAILGTDAGANRFVAGQSATIELSPARNQGDTAIFIPISSVKITPDSAVVFIVSEEGTLVSVPVTLGLLSGGKVEITSGLSLNNQIVRDARGLKDGQAIILKAQ